ncbi:cytochrome c [Pseudomaricurvus hydrocarbonicus]
MSVSVSADVESQIKHREATMEAIGGHFSSVFATLKSPEALGDENQFHAESIARLARIAVERFPEGSGDGETDALPAIWEKPEEFKKAMDAFVTKADAFAVASKSGDLKSFAGAAKELGGTCKGCHDDFKD